MNKCATCTGVGLVTNDGTNRPWVFYPGMDGEHMSIVLGNTSYGAKTCPECEGTPVFKEMSWSEYLKLQV